MFAQKIGLDGSEIERAHQVKHNNRGSNTNRPRLDTPYLLVFSPNDATCGKNVDQNNFEYRHFLRNDICVSWKSRKMTWRRTL